MTACEPCWSAASRRAALGQGHTANLYREELASHPEHADEATSPQVALDVALKETSS